MLKKEWATEYLVNLRDKFLAQEYPENLVKEQFLRALEVDRKDLLFRQNLPKKKKKVLCPLVTTYNSSNPPFATWIKEELEVLHQSPKMAELLPYISTVTRQNQNIGQIAIRARHWKGASENRNTSQ